MKDAKGAKMEILFKEESYRIMGACFAVCKEKGNGFPEAVYQECLAIELAERFPNQHSFLSRLSYIS